jgi:hypothetical protein
MTTPPVGVERRIGQRFDFNLPVSVRDVSTSAEGLGFTQDLSSRGAFFFTELPLTEGAEIELTLRMPSEITLGENMRVRCRGRILRIVNADDRRDDGKDFRKESDLEKDRTVPRNNPSSVETASIELKPKPPGAKIGVAVCLNGYDYLSDEDDGPAEFRRISALHSQTAVSDPSTPASIILHSSND